MSAGGINKPRVEVTATTTSQRVKIPFLRVQDASGNGHEKKHYGDFVRVFSDAEVFVEFGGSDVVATIDTDSDIVLKNNVEMFEVQDERITHIAVITLSGTADLNISTTSGKVRRVTM